MSDKKNTIELPRSVVQLYRFVSKDNIHEQLTRVYIDQDPDDDGRLSAAATTGTHMCVVTWTREKDSIKLPIVLSGSMLQAAAYRTNAATSWTLCERVVLHVPGRRLLIQSSVPQRGLYETEPDSKAFPWKKIYSAPVRTDAPVKAIQVNLHLVTEFARYLKACRIPGHECRLQIPGLELDPLRVDVENGDERIRYIVMPCRP